LLSKVVDGQKFTISTVEPSIDFPAIGLGSMSMVVDGKWFETF